MFKIYLLELEDNKYYIGKTNVIKDRVIQHFSGDGSKWTKLHKPKRVISVLYGTDVFDEEKHTLLAMHKYGITNVRGGSYTTINLSDNDVQKITEILRSMHDECYKCGQKGHFANKCSLNDTYCTECGGTGISYWSDGIYGACMECCCIDCGKSDLKCTCQKEDELKVLVETYIRKNMMGHENTCVISVDKFKKKHVVITNSMYCENIGKNHNSSCIKFIIEDNKVYQKCDETTDGMYGSCKDFEGRKHILNAKICSTIQLEK
jgi:hypothetical protein